MAVALSALPIAIPLVLPPISIQMPWLVVGLDFLIVLWMVNLYNFMDGIDGLATSQCVVYCAGVLLIGHPVAFTSELLWVLLGRRRDSCGSTERRRGSSWATSAADCWACWSQPSA